MAPASEARERWQALFEGTAGSQLLADIEGAKTPESDWAEYTFEKTADYTRAVIASFAFLEDGAPFSTAETGVFAGGTSAILLQVLGRRWPGRAVHVGVDPYFGPGQSYPDLADTYGLDAYLRALKNLGALASCLRAPYLPFVMSSGTFIHADLLPPSYRFRLFHLDGDHSREAVLRELHYFSSHSRDGAVFILDDVGEGFSGVSAAAGEFQQRQPNFTELKRFIYDLEAGRIGFAVYALPAGR